MRRTHRSWLYPLFQLLVVTFLGVGCASQAMIEDVMIPLPAIKKIVTATISVGIRSESMNGRELTTGYFAPNNFEEEATDKRERAYARIVILGSSRPYSIEIDVFVERKDRKQYVGVGPNPKLARQLATTIKQALADRREDRNVIDEFRPF